MSTNKINRILAVILAACLAICLRTLHLGVIQREAKLIEAQKPQLRTLIQKANRGMIVDRFGIPMAINRICYNAVVYYSQIAGLPQTQWKEEEGGKRVRIYPRKEYIQALSCMLGETLNEPADRIEDLIHSHASLFPHAPYLIKARLSEEEYYRLKGLERDWPGLHAEMASERFYPMQKTASHILGTMGAISTARFAKIAGELSALEDAVAAYEQGIANTLPPGHVSFESAYERLKELKEKAYTLRDSVGRSGIEAQFEEELRGYFGKKIFEVDQKGRYLRELSGGRVPVPGRQVVLSISSELQQFAEELLAVSEKDREGRSLGVDPIDKKRKVLKQPWIKGGALVALDPNNGEVLAMASFPRFDPNDFILKKRLRRWLENERYVGMVWDGEELLFRERFNGRRFVDETSFLTWDLYLDTVLPKEGPLRSFFQKCDDVRLAIQVQEDFETIRYFSGVSDPLKAMEELFGGAKKTFHEPRASAALRRLETLIGPLSSPEDKIFAIDLCRLCIDSSRFSDALIEKTGSLKLGAYRELCQSFFRLEKKAKEERAAQFRKEEFRAWREKHQKEFLAAKRKAEKERKTYARPYLDYLDQKEKELFAETWNGERLAAIQERLDQEPKLLAATKELSPELVLEFLRTFRSFGDLDRPLLRKCRKLVTEKDLAACFYPKGGYGHLRSHAFQTDAPQGSLFKLVTAYEGLRQGHNLVLIDEAGRDPKAVAYALNGTPYPRMYKGGRLPRSSNPQIGKIDVAGALEMTSNPYFSILAGDFLSDPDDLKIAAARFGYGEKSGLELPGEAKGLLPNDLKSNKTSLYSLAFGQHTLLSTPLQTALMLAAIANEGKVIQPKIAKEIVGLAPDKEIVCAFDNENRFAARELQALGIPFSLFTGVQAKAPLAEVGHLKTQVKRTIPMPPSIRLPLIDGMDRTLWSPKGTARPGIIRSLRRSKELLSEHLSLQHQIVGKTSTAEILYQANANPSSQAQMVKHAWFGAISFAPEYPVKIRYDHPELIVVVFLRFGDAGREAAPMAVQMVKKWREIKKRHAL